MSFSGRLFCARQQLGSCDEPVINESKWSYLGPDRNASHPERLQGLGMGDLLAMVLWPFQGALQWGTVWSRPHCGCAHAERWHFSPLPPCRAGLGRTGLSQHQVPRGLKEGGAGVDSEKASSSFFCLVWPAGPGQPREIEPHS